MIKTSLLLLLSVVAFFSSTSVFSEAATDSEIKTLDQLLQQVKNEQRSEKQGKSRRSGIEDRQQQPCADQ